jgi:hypothetical protein
MKFWKNKIRFVPSASLVALLLCVLSDNTFAHDLNTGAVPHNSNDIPISDIAFSWSVVPNTYEYQFVLARDSEITDIIIDTATKSTAYLFKGSLEYNTTYFWHYRGIKPVPGDWSPTFFFSTQSRQLKIENAPPGNQETTPRWVWSFSKGYYFILIAAAIVICLTIYRLKSNG